MLKGYVDAILFNLGQIAGLNDPQTKISPVGFYKMLLENNAMVEVTNMDEIRKGQAREVHVRYMSRGLESEVSTKDDCDAPIKPQWKTTVLNSINFAKIGIFISDDEMRKYELPATEKITIAEAVKISKLMYEMIRVHIGALINKIDSDLVAAQATQWGNNAATGSNEAQVIELDKEVNMEDGVIKLLMDAETNEVYGDLLICGSGRVRAYDIMEKMKKGADAQGFGAMNLNAYSDPKTATKWGKDHFGVFAKGAVGIVDLPQFVDAYAGEKGGSFFFRLPLPFEVNGEILPIDFDAQLKYNDCPVTNERGEVVTPRGWSLIISKRYGLFNMPKDTYEEGDPLHGVNGSFHYVAVAPKAVQTITPAEGAVFNTQAAPVAAAASVEDPAANAEGPATQDVAPENGPQAGEGTDGGNSK